MSKEGGGWFTRSVLLDSVGWVESDKTQPGGRGVPVRDWGKILGEWSRTAGNRATYVAAGESQRQCMDALMGENR